MHSRYHSNGHQLHFDSDETHLADHHLLYENDPDAHGSGSGSSDAVVLPVHPLVSSVLYLNLPDEEDIGGPTLVTDQLLSTSSVLSSSSSLSLENIAMESNQSNITTTCNNNTNNITNDLSNRQGWLYRGQCNRLAMFNAKYLHGVIPGTLNNTTTTTTINNNNVHTKRRLTFMVGFWEHINARQRSTDVVNIDNIAKTHSCINNNNTTMLVDDMGAPLTAGPGQNFPSDYYTAVTSQGGACPYKWLEEIYDYSPSLCSSTLISDDVKEARFTSVRNNNININNNSSQDLRTCYSYVPVVWEPVLCNNNNNIDLHTKTMNKHVSTSAVRTEIVQYHECFQGF